MINRLKNSLKIGVIEADMDAVVDAHTIEDKTGVKTIQLHTSGECHLDAKMVDEGVEFLNADGLDLVFLENIGNLVCPAEFDTGASMRLVILSIPEGDDKPLKYPLMFEVCDLVVINKTDVMPYFNFSLEKVKENIKFRNPKAEIIPISALKDENVDLVVKYLEDRIKNWRD